MFSFFTFFVPFFSTQAIEYQRVSLGDTIRIGEFLYEDDYSPSTADCTLTIYDSAGTQKYTGTMTENANGWHYHDYAVGAGEALGNWPTSMACGTAGVDLVIVDKTFTVIPTTATTNNAIAESVWGSSTRSLTTFGTLVADTASAVWASGTRTLSSFGTLAADVWASATRTLTGASLDSGSIATLSDVQTASTSLGARIDTKATLSNQTAGWTVVMSNADRVLAGNTYRAKIFLTNYASVPTNSFAVPVISLYDAARNLVVSGIAMTNLSAGVYEYTYSIPAAAAQGLWESIVSTEVESGKTIQTNDYWTVEGAPAQVIINSITDDTIPSINANVTISNEGLTGYEYQYEWCVVAGSGNSCGGGDDVFYASAAKYINAGEDWNTNLSATVPSAGDYYFKLVVYYGVEQSGAARSFTAFSIATTLSQEIFRFYKNQNSLNPNDPWPPGSFNIGENSDIFESQFPPLFEQIIRLRIGLKVTSRDLPATQKQFKMQFAELTGSSCLNQSSGWTDLGNPGSAALWRGIDIPGPSDGATLPQNLLSTGTVKGSYEKQNPTPWNPAVAQGQTIEYDWAIQNNIPSPTGKNYCFRMVESGGTLFDAYTRYPRVATIFTPSGSTSSTIDYATGGNLQHTNANGSKVTLTAPANYLPDSYTFTAYSFDYSNYIGQVGTQPSGKSGAHSYIYQMSAEKDNVPSSSFNQSLTLKIDYRDSEVSSLNESSLVIYKYDGTDWTALSTTVDSANNTATATVTSFSSFGLFGDAPTTPTPTPTPTSTDGGGGGGGGGGGAAAILPTSISSAVRNIADFNNDGKVNSVDFSIMLFFWKAKPPFNNPFVDTNKDARVDSVDFSILMYRWGGKN